jgi:hypothetical protein
MKQLLSHSVVRHSVMFQVVTLAFQHRCKTRDWMSLFNRWTLNGKKKKKKKKKKQQ